MRGKSHAPFDAIFPPPEGGRVRVGGPEDPSPRRWADGAARANAQRLRRDMTDAERALWKELRYKRLGGHRFRRQVPLGRYVADFACMAPKLVLEVDGGQHADRTAHDAARSAWLKSQGFRVLRFWNNEVLSNMEGVLSVIAGTLREADESR